MTLLVGRQHLSFSREVTLALDNSELFERALRLMYDRRASTFEHQGSNSVGAASHWHQLVSGGVSVPEWHHSRTGFVDLPPKALIEPPGSRYSVYPHCPFRATPRM